MSRLRSQVRVEERFTKRPSPTTHECLSPLKLDPARYGNHANRIVATQAGTEQGSRRADGVGWVVCQTCRRRDSFEATRDARGAARPNQVAGGVEDFKLNCIGELVRVVTDLDGPREPMRLYPGSGGAKNESLGHRTVSVVACLLPDTQARSGYGGGLAC